MSGSGMAIIRRRGAPRQVRMACQCGQALKASSQEVRMAAEGEDRTIRRNVSPARHPSDGVVRCRDRVRGLRRAGRFAVGVTYGLGSARNSIDICAESADFQLPGKYELAVEPCRSASASSSEFGRRLSCRRSSMSFRTLSGQASVARRCHRPARLQRPVSIRKQGARCRARPGGRAVRHRRGQDHDHLHAWSTPRSTMERH